MSLKNKILNIIFQIFDILCQVLGVAFAAFALIMFAHLPIWAGFCIAFLGYLFIIGGLVLLDELFDARQKIKELQKQIKENKEKQ